MKAIIVDDEHLAIQSLKGVLNGYFPEIQVLADCNSVPEAVKAIECLRPDVVFLDVEMPVYNGFELFDFIDSEQVDFHIVFVTAYSKYSLQAFEMSATDYLLKPVMPEQVARVLQKINRFAAHAVQYQVLKNNLHAGPAGKQKIVLHTADDIHLINLDDILFLEAKGSYTNFVTKTSGQLLISKRLSEFVFMEQDSQFFRCHRSFLVNLHHIQRVCKKKNELEMTDGNFIQLANDKRKNLLERVALL